MMSAYPFTRRIIKPWHDPYKAEAEGQEQATQAAPDACVVMVAKALRKRRMAEAVARHGSFTDPGLAGVANGPVLSHEKSQNENET